MIGSRSLKFILAGLVGVMTGLPSTTVLADDTEIYLGASANQGGVRPNVMFILDTSGSMSAIVEGTGKDRLDNMKEAFNLIMDSVNNINVGLMRFTDPGGPVLWPVSYINGDATAIEQAGSGTGFPVNVRVTNSNDDAEQRISTGGMDLTGTELEIVRDLGASGAPVTVTVADDPGLRVIDQSNNAEQSDNNIVTGNHLNFRSNQTNAVRFASVPVPAGATITDARVVFTAWRADSSSPTFTITGEDSVSPAAFSTSCSSCPVGQLPSGRAPTAASVTWAPSNWSSGEKGPDTTTPNLSAIVQEIVNKPGWATGNPMVFVIPPSTSGGERQAYSFQGAGGTASRRPELQVTYGTAPAAAENQLLGLRFDEVPIPQGVTITSALLEFHPAVTSNNDILVNITGEDTGDAAPFTSGASNISNRTTTTASAEWKESDNWDDVDAVHQSVDISNIVQEIVNRGDWCGNNAMALIVRDSIAIPNGATGPLSAESYDSDPSRAPILRVNYNQAAVPANACINNIVSSQVFTSTDDAEETLSSGSVALTGSQLDMNSNQVNGLRFDNIPINQGATVVEATLTFVARNIDTSATTLTFKAEAADDSAPFSSSDDDISDRDTTAASVNWVAPDFDVAGEPHVTVDLSSIVQAVINRSGWEAFNALTIIQSHAAGGQRRARTFNDSPIDAPILTIKVQGAGATATTTVRTRLKQIVDGLDHNGFTPTIDTLYEAALYYRGDDVDWGAQRGFDNDSGNPACNSPPHLCNSSFSNPSVRRNTRVSHPGSWTGGTIVKPAGCTDANLSAAECEDEVIINNPTYVSPIEQSCQANYVVLLTDGFANHNDSVTRIQSNFGFGCQGSTNGDETCGVELAKFLNEKDQIPGLPGDQTVTTYTIGFNFNTQFLQDVATAGGGDFYSANTAAELADVFQNILADILSRSTSFATPSLSVNAFNKLFDRDDVYFSLFIPNSRARWKGNVKRYQICSNSTLCDLGEILDVDGNSAISDVNQLIKDSAKSFWSSVIDGAEVELGGAAENVPAAASRKVYTLAAFNDADANGELDLLSPALLDENLSLTVNAVTDANDDGILDGLVGHSDHPDPLADTRVLLGDPAGLMSDQERADLIDWIRGQDVDDEDEDGSTADNRFTFSDALHSSPVAITYGGTDAAPVVKLFVGTNDGGLQMINAATGVEEWVFYPQSMLQQQDTLRANPNGEHLYGLDTVPSPWIYDANEDGIIDEADGDFVRIFIAQRRGGNHVFALDVTPDSVLTNPNATGGIDPTLMWRIDGGTADFPNLGQTWSRPVVSQVRVGTTEVGESEFMDVVAFAGGYDVTQDNGFFGPGGQGNSIYIADALTGERLFTLSSDDPGTGDFLVVPEMNCPIPSDLAFFDSDGDGGEDRMYVGDTCGQLWRVDLLPDLTASTGVKAVVGKFAELSDLSGGADVEEKRKVFYRPDVVQVLNSQFSDTARYDLVVAVTGRRDNPLNTEVEDRAFALRDFHVETLTDADSDGFADFGTYPTIDGFGPSPTDLFDATSAVNDPEDADLTQLQTSSGWFINLEQPGEKALAAPVILSGKLFFTTYLPEGVVDASTCALAEGSGLLYGVNVLTGGVALNWDDADGTENLTLSDKTYTLGAGIPSSAVPIFQEEGVTLLVGGGGGATTVDPNIDLPRGRSYWYQQ